MGLVSLVGSIVLLFLLIFRASTWACLFCFTTYDERLRVCQLFVGREENKIKLCKDELAGAFEDLEDTKISEEPLLPEPGPWGGEGESLSYSKKKSQVQNHDIDTEKRDRWEQWKETGSEWGGDRQNSASERG